MRVVVLSDTHAPLLERRPVPVATHLRTADLITPVTSARQTSSTSSANASIRFQQAIHHHRTGPDHRADLLAVDLLCNGRAVVPQGQLTGFATAAPDMQGWTIWRRFITIAAYDITLYLVLDEAHRGFNVRTTSDKPTIVRRLVNGTKARPPIPIAGCAHRRRSVRSARRAGCRSAPRPQLLPRCCTGGLRLPIKDPGAASAQQAAILADCRPPYRQSAVKPGLRGDEGFRTGCAYAG